MAAKQKDKNKQDFLFPLFLLILDRQQYLEVAPAKLYFYINDNFGQGQIMHPKYDCLSGFVVSKKAVHSLRYRSEKFESV